MSELSISDLQIAHVLAGAVALLAIVLGLAGATRSAELFEVAGRRVMPLMGGLAIGAAFLSIAPFAGLAGIVFQLGSDGLAWLVGCAAGLVLMGVLIAPAFRASQAATVPEFLGSRFGGRAIPMTAAIVVVLSNLLLLVTQLTAMAMIGQSLLGVPFVIGVGAAAVIVLLALLPGGMRGAIWSGGALLAVVLVTYLVPLAIMALQKHGMPLGQLAYGQMLQDLPRLETDMIVNEVADARSLKPHVRPFLQIDLTNTLALIACLMAGSAVLPHVLMRSATSPSVKDARLSMAWGLLFSAVILSAVPAYAAFTKHELYGLIAKGVPLSELPRSFAEASRRDAIRIHGVSLKLFDDVTASVVSGNSDAGAVGKALQETRASTANAWFELKPQVQGALVEAGKLAVGQDEAQRWETLKVTVLPVAATAAGNKSGKLTQSAVVIEPHAVAVFGLALAGLSPMWIAVFAAGAIAAGLATAIATSWAAGQALGRDIAGTRGLAAARLGIVVAVGVAAVLAAVKPADLLVMAAWPFAIAAAGLFPVLVLGIWWKRTTRTGALAGMIAGLAVTLIYIGGSGFAPVTFFQATGAVSDAGPTAAKKVADLTAVAEKASEQGRAAADGALTAFVRGGPFKAGIANWFGIHNAAAAIFGLPLGFLLIILISLLTQRPSAETLQFVEAIRRPPAPARADS